MAEILMTKLKLMILLTSLVSATSFAAPREALVPGGLAMMELPNYTDDTVVRFKGRRVAVYEKDNTWYALAGISLSTKPGEYEITIEKNGTTASKKTLRVAAKSYQEQHLTIKNKRKVNPAPMDMERIGKERIKKREAKSVWTSHTPDIDFIWPVSGEISSIFGLRRFFNEQERRPHTGLDIAAPEGKPVQATADGKVVEAGDFFFSGNMIYIDHGQGIISLYAHLSRIGVKPGDSVRQGDIIGAVGQTGRVTGPHLHFAVFANKTLIDPVFMLPIDQPVEQALQKAAQRSEKQATQQP